MFELVKAGGFVMLPILLCSIVATAIILERFWSLRRKRIVPDNLVVEVWQRAKQGRIDEEHIHLLRQSSPLGRILAAGLDDRHSSREIMKESIEEAGRHVVHSLERYLNTLGTIAAIAPLLGLLGTVIGMIKVFAVITVQGIGNPGVLASGISEALITTAAGLTVAIPTLIFYRYFRGKIDGLVVDMEQEALKMIEVLEGMRGRDRYNSGLVK
uniref:Biopolymer transport protein ExbB n=1 Tax=Candidatus Kentrum sp. LFY TaxID=2126342 RepID=A0A450U7L9_9GAMM|nr:MAG: biopolymer transport protein ExbB [Candidatus Kentron sp. LFY]VFJ87729.1 MAG: biopolymer transport protein ExbB [Candidatus Kentron sp. LFY]VFK14491.1 MAG: biopolymer transport protein ExbB [Candidatus Kentron sp. LFY]